MKRTATDRLRAELLRAAASRSGVRRRRRWSLGTLAVLVAVTVTGVAIAAVGISVFGGAAPDDPDDPPIYAPRSFGKAIPLTRADRAQLRRARERRAPITDAAASFAVLRSARARRTTRFDALAYVRAYRGRDGIVDVRATDREVCVHFRHTLRGGATGTCLPTVRARSRGAFVIEQCDRAAQHPQRRVVAGVAPDGVGNVSASRKGVVQARVAIHHNAFVLITDEPFDTLQIGRAIHPVPPVTC